MISENLSPKSQNKTHVQLTVTSGKLELAEV